MIKFPKPLDWLQKKMWRIKWIEWSIIMLMFFIMMGSPGSAAKMSFVERAVNNIMSFLIMVPVLGLIITFTWKYIFIGPFKLAAMIPGFGRVASVVVVTLEAFAGFISGFNDELIMTTFCEEQPKPKK